MRTQGLRYLRFYPIRGGSDESDPPAEPPKQDPPTSGDKDGSKDERRFSQAELDAIVKDRLDRERRKSEEQQRKTAEEAEAQRLKDQQEWQKLAEQRQAQVAELEPVKAKAERYEAALTKHLDTQRKDLPAHITELLDQLDVAAQLEWIAAHHDELSKTAPNGAAIRETPRQAGAPNRAEVIDEKVTALRRTGGYGRF